MFFRQEFRLLSEENNGLIIKDCLMLYRQKFDTFIRNYGEFGYITNTANFSDQVVNNSGAVFLAVLSREPQSLDLLTERAAQVFSGVSPGDILEDVRVFYDALFEDGFLTRGKTIEELNANDRRFSYSDIEPKTIKQDFTPLTTRSAQNTQDFLEKHFKDNPQLSSFQIELTSRCNERCVHCYIPHELKNTRIQPELYTSVLMQLKDMGTLNISLSGGEPMCHPQFKDFLRQAKEYDFYVNVLTNLTLLDDETVDIMKNLRLSSVQVSLYSMNPEVHDAITLLPGSFEKTKRAILQLVENDIPLQISCPTMKLNKDDYGDVLRWAHEHKIRAVTDYIMMARYDHTIDNLDNRLSLKEVGTVINDILADDIDYQRELLQPDFEEKVLNLSYEPDGIVCGVGVASACMVANGNVYPCAGWQDYVCGNLNEESLHDIWYNSEKMNFLRKIRNKDFPECMSCSDKAFCAMCMVRNANESPDGDPFNINKHFCKVAKLNHEIVMDWRRKKLASVNA